MPDLIDYQGRWAGRPSLVGVGLWCGFADGSGASVFTANEKRIKRYPAAKLSQGICAYFNFPA